MSGLTYTIPKLFQQDVLLAGDPIGSFTNPKALSIECPPSRRSDTLIYSEVHLSDKAEALPLQTQLSSNREKELYQKH